MMWLLRIIPQPNGLAYLTPKFNKLLFWARPLKVFKDAAMFLEEIVFDSKADEHCNIAII